jgi:AsmA protein
MRWLFRVAGSLLVLALLALAIPFLIPTETVARLATAQIERLTGRALTIEGAVRPTVWPHLGVRTGAVTLANAPWSDAGPMLRADGLAIAVDMAALIGGTVRVTGIEMQTPRLLLERSADGQVNWVLSAPATAGAEGAAPAAQTAATPFTIDRAQIADGTVTYVDHASGRRFEATEVTLDAAIPDFQGEATLKASARVNGQPVALAGTVSAFAPFLDGQVVPLALTASVGGSEAGFEGRLGTAPLAAEGAASLALGDLPALYALMGQPAPALPPGLGRGSIALTGALTLTPEGSLHLRDGVVALDDNRFAGAFDLVQGPDRPKLTAQLTAGALNLASLGQGSGGAPASGGGGAGAPAAVGWSTAPIDASGLGALDAAVSLAADSIDLGSVALGPTRLGLTIDAARAVVDLQQVAAYGGTLAGQVVLNARSGLSARANLSMQGLALQPLLVAFAGTDRITGTGDIRFNLLGVGGSLDALMKSLSGDASLAFRQGELLGFDLAGMIRTLDAGFVGEGASTVFDSITASFAIENGVARNGDLALAAPLITASGAGTVDIGNQSLDYRLTPLTLGGRELNTDVQVPVLISGPWAAPNIRLDLESLAERRFEEEKQKLEDRARAEIEQKLQEELGVTVQEGESLEDTARRAAEQMLQDEATRALERLLGGGSGE